MDVSIWPGSSSFTTVSASYYNTPSTGSAPTPFGFYDNDALFKVDADRFATWCASRLGYPISDIELQDRNFWAAIEEGISEYSTQVNQWNIKEHFLTLQGNPTSLSLTQREITPNFGRMIRLSKMYGAEAGVGGDTTWYSGSITTTPYQQNYDLSNLAGGADIEIKRVFHTQPPAIIRFFDPLAGTGASMNNMMDAFGWGGMSPASSFMMMPLYSDLLRVQAIEFNDQIRKSQYSFELINNQLKIFPRPDREYKIWIQYIKTTERDNPLQSATGSISDVSNVPYSRIDYSNITAPGRQWIYKYSLALAKETLGYIRSKYQSIPFAGSGGEITINGESLITEGNEEKSRLTEELTTLLEATGRQAQMERQQATSDALNNELQKSPLKIYIG